MKGDDALIDEVHTSAVNVSTKKENVNLDGKEPVDIDLIHYGENNNKKAGLVKKLNFVGVSYHFDHSLPSNIQIDRSLKIGLNLIIVVFKIFTLFK